ncbi:galanin receptor type 2-like [Ambystoma mexicanum]|uniref:galanin receptor type 2-like n=1 Tax=Ambystoma mexicanum TaxID=8296 RepID=UPI0037E96162
MDELHMNLSSGRNNTSPGGEGSPDSSVGTYPGQGLSEQFVVRSNYAFASFYALIFVIGLPGNILMFQILLQGQRKSGSGVLSRTTAPVIMNVVLSDLAFLLYCVPVMFVNTVWEDWQMGKAMCISHKGLFLWCVFVRFYSMLAVSVLRYAAVIHPTCSRSLSQQLMVGICFLIWSMSLIVSIPYWIYATAFNLKGFASCQVIMTKEQTALYSRLLGGVAFFPATLLIVMCYSSIIYALWCRKTLIVHSASSLRANRRATIMILATIVAFIIMWIPCWVLLFLSETMTFKPSPGVFLATNMTYFLAYTNCCANPIIYFALSDHFQAKLKKLFGCVCNNDMKKSRGPDKGEGFETVTSSLETENTS